MASKISGSCSQSSTLNVLGSTVATTEELAYGASAKEKGGTHVHGWVNVTLVRKGVCFDRKVSQYLGSANLLYSDSANMLHIPEQNRLIFIPLYYADIPL